MNRAQAACSAEAPDFLLFLQTAAGRRRDGGSLLRRSVLWASLFPTAPALCPCPWGPQGAVGMPLPRWVPGLGHPRSSKLGTPLSLPSLVSGFLVVTSNLGELLEICIFEKRQFKLREG